ncbi:hypothetical protein [Providencia heimbachae]|nr:hypothetical protein [Providencia heimbachae]
MINREVFMGSEGFDSPNRFRAQLDKQLKDERKDVNGYQPVRSCKGEPIPPPKKS